MSHASGGFKWSWGGLEVKCYAADEVSCGQDIPNSSISRNNDWKEGRVGFWFDPSCWEGMASGGRDKEVESVMGEASIHSFNRVGIL